MDDAVVVVVVVETVIKNN